MSIHGQFNYGRGRQSGVGQFLFGSGVHRVGLDLVFSMFLLLDFGGAALFIVHLFCVVLSRAHFTNVSE